MQKISKLNKILLLSNIAVICVFIFTATICFYYSKNKSDGIVIGGYAFGKLEDKPEFVKGRQFIFNSDIQIFQFEDENIFPYQEQINKALMSVKDEWVKDFDGDLKFFFYDWEDFDKYICELSISSEVQTNTPQFFSVGISIYAYHHGANGCQSHIKAFNFKIENNEAKLFTLDNITSSKENKLKLLAIAMEELHKNQKVDELKDSYSIESLQEADTGDSPLSSQVEFTLNKEGIIIGFQPYSIACGASGVLFSELKYGQIEDLLSQDAKEIISHLKN